jgi:phosphoglycerol transferase MdoB-like AlkP superfamily enzyme
LNDRDFLRQALSHVRALPEPFFAWLTTLSLHHPFADFPSNLKTLNVGRWANHPFGNYVHAMHLFDVALGDFLTGLRRDRLLDRSVLVVLGDHDAGLAWEEPLARTLGFGQHVFDWTMQDRVPLIIRVPGAGAPVGEQTRIAGQTDLAPTLLALLGVDPADMPFVGRNLLGEPGSGPVVRPLGEWVDEAHLFVSPSPEHPQGVCYELKKGEAVDLAACAEGSAAADLQRAMSATTVAYDLQDRLVLPPQDP